MIYMYSGDSYAVFMFHSSQEMEMARNALLAAYYPRG